MKLLSPRTHSIIGIIVGVALLFAPNIFRFSDVGGAAVTIPRVIGILVILSELIVKGGFSGFNIVPMKTHLTMDFIMGAFLALSPWIFGFNSAKANAWIPHLIVGLLIIGYVPITRTAEDESRVSHRHRQQTA